MLELIPCKESYQKVLKWEAIEKLHEYTLDLIFEGKIEINPTKLSLKFNRDHSEE